jgi:hypothetical protein
MIVDDKYFQSHFSGEFNQSVCGPWSVTPSGPWSHCMIISLRVLQLLRYEDRRHLEYTSAASRCRERFRAARNLFVGIETCRILPPLRGRDRFAGD